MTFERHPALAGRPAEAPPEEPAPAGRPGRRRWLVGMAVIGGAAVAGFGAAALWLSPVPIFGATHSVPRLIDQPLPAAQEQLRRLGYRVRLERPAADPAAPRGQIVWQDPPPGVVLEQGDPVTLTPSAGPPQVPVPDVGRFEPGLAGRILAAAGFSPGRSDSLAATDLDSGVVVSTRPPAGTPQVAGSPVDLIVSGGR